jgi:hypothetical protein
MKKVGDATTDVGYGSGWFKIMEAGLNAGSKAESLRCTIQLLTVRILSAQDWAVTDLVGCIQSPSGSTSHISRLLL